jgi:hypothetical protein
MQTAMVMAGISLAMEHQILLMARKSKRSQRQPGGARDIEW